MCPEDAALAVQHGADAIVVSNHGGRQLDGSPPTLAVIERIAQTVNKKIPVVSFSVLNKPPVSYCPALTGSVAF